MATWKEVMAGLWGECNPVHEHQLDRYIQGLKRKIEGQQTFPGAIVAARGVGFMFRIPG